MDMLSGMGYFNLAAAFFILVSMGLMLGRLLGGPTLYDRLLAVQTELQRGPHGADKPMSMNASMLAKVAQLRSADRSHLERLIGEKYAERFGDAFLEVLEGV